MKLWIQESHNAGIRKVSIHFACCSHCESRKKETVPGKDSEHWYGPFDDLGAARAASDSIPNVAIRSECQCVRRVLPKQPRLTLEDPLFRQRQAQQSQRPRPKPAAKAQKAAVPTLVRPTARAKKPSRARRYAWVAAMAAVLVIGGSMLMLPSLSVSQAVDPARPNMASFYLLNSSPAAVTDVAAECRLEFKPTSTSLKEAKDHVADRLDYKNQVSMPCFQTAGSIPQTNGVTLEVTVSYAIFGIRRTRQTFSFQAARTNEGIYRWFYLG